MRLPIVLVLLITICLMAPTSSKAQSLSIDALELSFSNLEGSFGKTNYSTFVGSSRNPLVFQTEPQEFLGRDASFVTSSFSILFLLKNAQREQDEYVVGFGNGNIAGSLYEFRGLRQDSISVLSSISSRTEYFFLTAGYQRLFRKDKRFKLLVGARLTAGIPVSAKVNELFKDQSDSTNQDIFGTELSFFAKQSASFTFATPFGFRWRMFRNVSLSYLVSPSYQLNWVDRSRFHGNMSGGIFSFQFQLQPR